MAQTIKIYYDDEAHNIISKVNSLLENHGLRFEFDGLEHDSFEILELKRTVEEN